jgi:hypothetical protein
MYGTMNIKFNDAKQAIEVFQYKNTKRKLYRTNAAIWYNKTCRQKKLTPAYINIHMNGTNQQCRRTLRAAKHYRINQEISFLYAKKIKLNEQLYKLHHECANKWPDTWQIVLQSIDQTLTHEMDTHYNNLNKKLDRLRDEQQRGNKANKNQPHNRQHHQFYTRTANLTGIKFTNEEITLLNKGLQHSIEKPVGKYWDNLIIETEQAIRKLDIRMQAPFRMLANKKLKQISATSSEHNTAAKRQSYILKSITSKLKEENATIVKADKGKTSVIIYTEDYNRKVYDFLDNNNFQKLPKDPTTKYQKHITTNIKNCDLIIPKNQTKHLTQKNHQSPQLKAQIKIHKPGNPNRPIINNRTAPTYKIAKLLAKKLKGYTHLKHQYNVTNSTTLANDLTKLKPNENHRMLTFDIRDLYVNIPINDTIRITRTLIANHNNEQITKELTTLLETVLKQNYLSFQGNIYQTTKGVSMGSPISGNIAEIFLQHRETTQLKQIIGTKNIVFLHKIHRRHIDNI